ncbi:antirestriction protein ArdA [Nisaea nitritireducens]|uniref:antirestriction protein ArdA n=1 Tax=Nisaea nitritireducens TaxID=568392 RepID=UPI0018685303|nr:antirestriction protein ArdA [Nisaea nitritireducens]
MTIVLFAQPYDIAATGFYFETAEQYDEHAAKALNDYGQPVEEFEIQFIDGERIDCELAKAWQLHQGNFGGYLTAAGDWEEDRKRLYIIAVGECGYSHEEVAGDPDFDGVEILPYTNLESYAEQLVADGVFGDIPESFRKYIDYWHIATDLALEYGSTTIAGEVVHYAHR